MNQTPSKVVYLVIILLGVIALIGVSSLCMTMFYKSWADPAVLTSIITITSTVCGSLGTILSNTRSQAVGGQTTSTTTTTTAPPPPTEPQTVIVANKPSDPVPTVET